MTRTVTGMMAMMMGSSISPISAQSSITPAAAGTKSSGKIPVRNTPTSFTSSSWISRKFRASSSSTSPYTLAGTGSGSTA